MRKKRERNRISESVSAKPREESKILNNLQNFRDKYTILKFRNLNEHYPMESSYTYI